MVRKLQLSNLKKSFTTEDAEDTRKSGAVYAGSSLRSLRVFFCDLCGQVLLILALFKAFNR